MVLCFDLFLPVRVCVLVGLVLNLLVCFRFGGFILDWVFGLYKAEILSKLLFGVVLLGWVLGFWWFVFCFCFCLTRSGFCLRICEFGALVVDFVV